MSRISQEKKEKIMSNIIATIFENFPNQLFTAEISRIELRDEEFIKRLLFELKEKGLVVPIRKNTKGEAFSRRIKWRLSNKAYEAYKLHQ